MLQVADRATDWSESNPPPGRETSERAAYLEELAANAGYASLVSIVTAVLFVVASSTSDWPLRVFSALGIAAGVHLSLTLLMVMKRVFLWTQRRLVEAHTGTNSPRAA